MEFPDALSVEKRYDSCGTGGIMAFHDVGLENLFLFVPLLILLLLANLGEGHKIWKVISFLLNLLFSLAWVFAGLGMVMYQRVARGGHIALGVSSMHLKNAGWVALAIGLLSLLVFVPNVRRKLRWRSHGFDPYAHPPHATALLMALWLFGMGAGQWVMFWGVQDIPKGIPHLSLWEVASQGAIEALMALIGIGWLVRRGWKDALRRLGFGGMKAWYWVLAAAAISAVYSLNLAYGVTMYLVDPQKVKEIEEINRALLGGVYTPWGALTLGVSAGIGEEMVFRGALQPRLGIVLTSFLFMLAHTQYALSPGVVLIFLIGVVLGLLRRYANLTVAIVAHAGYDALAVMLISLAQKLAGG